jgi:hypothetical protein
VDRSLIALALLAAACAGRNAERRPGPVPGAMRETFDLAPFYVRAIDADGLPVVGSAKVSDAALREAAFLIDRMLRGRDDIRRAMAARKVRFTVMAPEEMTTDVPEHSDLKPKDYWDRRARGLGATAARPSVSCGEENLLQLKGDPYATENILIHEFAHAIHEMGLSTVDRTFDRRLRAAYEAAMKEGLWKEKYAATNRQEYWAEGVQSWFDTNRHDDHDHNHVDTREELVEYDPRLAALIGEVFVEDDWRYVGPKQRPEPGHLRGFDREAAKPFVWPERLRNVDVRGRR